MEQTIENIDMTKHGNRRGGLIKKLNKDPATFIINYVPNGKSDTMVKKENQKD